jgi:hypothetical protein
MNKLCQLCNQEFIKKSNESKKYWETKKYCSKKCADTVFLFQKGTIPWNKGKKYPQVTGSLNSKWKGGITPINEKIRKSIIYKIWINAVFQKDNYTCQICEKHGGDLHAYHLKPFAIYKELRFAIDNGQTLCIECHRKLDHIKLLTVS